MEEMTALTHLIIPGGESTVIARFLFETGLAREIQKRVSAEHLAVFGTCAGAIVLAGSIKGPHAPRVLKLLDCVIDRNAYGTQAQSFAARVSLRRPKVTFSASFIRAPKILRAGGDVEILAVHEGSPVVIRQGRILAAACHPEMRGETVLHKLFLTL